MLNNSKKVQKIPVKPEKDLEPLNVLERYSPEVKEFSSVKEFQVYLTDNKDDMDSMTTQKLNKTFKVTEGSKVYTITKKLGKISLKLVKCCDEDNNNEEIEDLRERLCECERKIEALVTVMINNRLIPEE